MSQAEAVRPSVNPGARQRAAEALRADPARSDRLVARALGITPSTVGLARRELEAAGEIPPTPVTERVGGKPGIKPWTLRPARLAAADELREDPARSDELIAQAAGVSHTTVSATRAILEDRWLIGRVPVSERHSRPPPQRPSRARDAIAQLGPDATARQVAERAGISLRSARRMLQVTPQFSDVAAATDALTVIRVIPRRCARCREPFTPDRLPWLIVISVAAARFLWAAVGGAGDEAGRDAWKGLKWLVAALYEARRSSRSPQGGVSISDQETGVEIQFPPGLPDRAYIRIVQIESPSAPLSGILRWDENAQD